MTEFLTVAEIAGRLRLSKMSVYRMVRSGELPALQIGRTFRVRASVLENWLAEKERPPVKWVLDGIDDSKNP